MSIYPFSVLLSMGEKLAAIMLPLCGPAATAFCVAAWLAAIRARKADEEQQQEQQQQELQQGGAVDHPMPARVQQLRGVADEFALASSGMDDDDVPETYQCVQTGADVCAGSVLKAHLSRAHKQCVLTDVDSCTGAESSPETGLSQLPLQQAFPAPAI
eukprot:1157632-Pelagomonas_calceolata.AAC.5